MKDNNMRKNATVTSALEQRITSQKKQSIDLNKWIFENIVINSDDHILELCCGTGAQTKYFADKISSGTLTAVDINEESIEIAQKSITNNNVNFVVSEIDKIENFNNKNYDLIFSAYGFYYSKNSEKLHSNLKNHLNENGRFVIVGPVVGNNKQLYEIIRSIGCKVPADIMEGSERFMLHFFETFLNNYKNVSIVRAINEISYDNSEKLLNYWKNTTFYTSGYDKEFLNAVDEYFDNEIIINKSISILKGSL